MKKRVVKQVGQVGIVVSSIVVLIGCASTPNDYSPYVHDQAKSVRLYSTDNPPQGDFKILEEITSNSCNSKTKDQKEGDENEARQLLSLRAAEMNADAVLDVVCWTSKVDLKSNCWSAKKCKGLAVQKK